MNAHTISRRSTLEANFRRLQFLALAIILSLLTLQTARAGPGSEERNERPTLTGTWLGGVTRPAPLPPLLGLGTYFEDGNYIGESNSTVIRSLEHGTWEKVGKRQFTRSSLNFKFGSPARDFVGTTKITATVTLSKDGESLEGTSTIEQFDTGGNLISSIQGIESAKRVGF